MDDELKQKFNKIEKQLQDSRDREKVLYDELIQLSIKHYELHETVLKNHIHSNQQQLDNIVDEKDEMINHLESRTVGNHVFTVLYQKEE